MAYLIVNTLMKLVKSKTDELTHVEKQTLYEAASILKRLWSV